MNRPRQPSISRGSAVPSRTNSGLARAPSHRIPGTHGQDRQRPLDNSTDDAERIRQQPRQPRYHPPRDHRPVERRPDQRADPRSQRDQDWRRIDRWLRAQAERYPNLDLSSDFERNDATRAVLIALIDENEETEAQEAAMEEAEAALWADIQESKDKRLDEARPNSAPRDGDGREGDVPLVESILDAIHHTLTQSDTQPNTPLETKTHGQREVSKNPATTSSADPGPSSESVIALETLAQLSQILAVPAGSGGSVVRLAHTILDLHTRQAITDDIQHRLSCLQRVVNEQIAAVKSLLYTLPGVSSSSPLPSPLLATPPSPSPPSLESVVQNLMKGTLDAHREIHSLEERLEEYRQQLKPSTLDLLSQTGSTQSHDRGHHRDQSEHHPSIDEIVRLEEDYQHLAGLRRQLKERLDAFSGLPPDVASAQTVVEQFRTEVQELATKRDAIPAEDSERKPAPSRRIRR